MRSFLIRVGILALMGFLAVDIARPKFVTAEDTSAAAPAAEVPATPEAASIAQSPTGTAPKQALSETSGSATQDTETEETSVRSMQGPAQAESKYFDEAKEASSASTAEPSDEKESAGEAISAPNDAEAVDETVVR